MPGGSASTIIIIIITIIVIITIIFIIIIIIISNFNSIVLLERALPKSCFVEDGSWEIDLMFPFKKCYVS